MTSVKLSEIQFFDYTQEVQTGENEYETVAEYSANLKIEIDGRVFCAQWSGRGEEAHRLSIPTSEENFWTTEEDQDWAYENIDCEDLEWELEEMGHENNFGYLEDSGERM